MPSSPRCGPMIPGGSAATGWPGGSPIKSPVRATRLSCPGCPTAPRSRSCCSAPPRPRMRPPGTDSPPKPGRPAGSPRSAPRGSWTPGSCGPALPGQRVHRGAVADRGGRDGGAAGRAGAQRTGHRRGYRAGRHPPGRAGARRLRPGRSHSGCGGTPGGPVQHHPALRHRHAVRRPVLLGPDRPVRRVWCRRTGPGQPARLAARRGVRLPGRPGQQAAGPGPAHRAARAGRPSRRAARRGHQAGPGGRARRGRPQPAGGGGGTAPVQPPAGRPSSRPVPPASRPSPSPPR